MSQDIIIDPEATSFARRALFKWHEGAARPFPWRYDPDPYHVLMAEMMLRRTQARQVIAAYQAFVNRYPTVADLDQAPTGEVLELLKPLGLSWRAANFKVLAHEIMTRHGGTVPREREALLSLTGVGAYVADAVRCFAFDEVAALVDTNTVRVAARYYGFDYNQESRRRSAVIKAVASLVEPEQSSRSNYALLDFAARVCTSRNPDHEKCPLTSQCIYFSRTWQGD